MIYMICYLPQCFPDPLISFALKYVIILQNTIIVTIRLLVRFIGFYSDFMFVNIKMARVRQRFTKMNTLDKALQIYYDFRSQAR